MRPEDGAFAIRSASVDDAHAIGDLHARSWAASYRGSMSDAYLDGPVFEERRAFWRERLSHPRPGLLALIAERDGALAGFACALRKHDPRWGSMVDNLHADPALKRQGIGRALMRALAALLADDDPQSPVHLFVLRANTSAAAFYVALGGEAVEALVKTEPDGTSLPVLRMAWPDATSFRRRVA